MPDRRFKVLMEWDPRERVMVTYVPSLNFLSTFGETREEAIERTREAIRGYIETATLEGLPIPEDEGQSELIEIAV